MKWRSFVYYCTTNINLSLIFGTLYLWPFRQHFPHNIIIVGLNLEYPSSSHFVFLMWYDYTQSYESAITIISSVTYLPWTLYHHIPEIAQKCCVSGRDLPDTTLPDIGLNQIQWSYSGVVGVRSGDRVIDEARLRDNGRISFPVLFPLGSGAILWEEYWERDWVLPQALSVGSL